MQLSKRAGNNGEPSEGEYKFVDHDGVLTFKAILIFKSSEDKTKPISETRDKNFQSFYYLNTQYIRQHQRCEGPVPIEKDIVNQLLKNSHEVFDRVYVSTPNSSDGSVVSINLKDLKIVNTQYNAGLPYETRGLFSAIPQHIFQKTLVDLSNMAEIGCKALREIMAQSPAWRKTNTVMEITGPLRLLALIGDSRFGDHTSLKSQLDAKSLISADDFGNYFISKNLKTNTFALLTQMDLDRMKDNQIPHVDYYSMLRNGRTYQQISSFVDEKVNKATDGLIPELTLPSDISGKRLALFTTAYFKDLWRDGPFKSEKKTFHKADGSSVLVDSVEGKNVSTVYKKQPNGDILALLPFKTTGWYYAIHQPAKTPQSVEEIPFFNGEIFKEARTTLPRYAKDISPGTLYSGKMEVSFPQLDITADHKDLHKILKKQFSGIGKIFWKDHIYQCSNNFITF